MLALEQNILETAESFVLKYKWTKYIIVFKVDKDEKILVHCQIYSLMKSLWKFSRLLNVLGLRLEDFQHWHEQLNFEGQLWVGGGDF